MADFHSSDGWFIWGIITIILHLALCSGWHRLRHVLYSKLWPVFSLMEMASAILSIILHSKLSSPPLLLATTLWSLLGLAILMSAVARSYLQLTIVMEAKQKRVLRFLKWTQYLTWFAVPFFVSSTTCWARSNSVTPQRVYYRSTARVLNWTGGALLVLCFIASTTAGFIICSWSLPKKKVPSPVPLITVGALLSVPFILVRLGVQLYWMRYRNSNGATFGLHIGCSVVMDLMIPIINLTAAWYTFSTVNNNAFLELYKLCTEKKQEEEDVSTKGSSTGAALGDKSGRRVSMMSSVSAAGTTTMASISRATSFIGDRMADQAFPSQFEVKSTGHVYKMDQGNALIRGTKRVHKIFQTGSDSEIKQSPFCLNPITIRADARHIVAQIAKLLWLFVLWEACRDGDADQRRAIEIDILSTWYEDVFADVDLGMPHLHVMRPFGEIKDAVLGSQRRRPVEKMLGRVYLHFFNKLGNHAIEARAAACLFALRLMLKKDLGQSQPFEQSFVDIKEAAILDIDEGMWRKYDELVAGRVASKC